MSKSKSIRFRPRAINNDPSPVSYDPILEFSSEKTKTLSTSIGKAPKVSFVQEQIKRKKYVPGFFSQDQINMGLKVITKGASKGYK